MLKLSSMLKISRDENLSNKIYKSIMENDTIKSKINGNLEEIDVYLLYKLSEKNLFNAIEGENNVIGFDFEDTFISNPFVDELDFEFVNPITYYGNAFLESEFINLLKEIVELRKGN